MKAVVDLEKILHRDMTVEVEILHVKRVEIRLWIAERLIRLAVWIAGMKLKVTQRAAVIVDFKDMQIEKVVKTRLNL